MGELIPISYNFSLWIRYCKTSYTKLCRCN